MDLSGKRFLAIGGAGFIGSHTIEELLKHDIKEVIIYDNMTRGSLDNLKEALKDPRVSIFPAGGDILHLDTLKKAMENIDGVFHFAALWLLHCYDYPRAAFEVNIGGTFNVIETCLSQGVKRLVYSSSASVYGNALFEPMTEDHPFNNDTFYGATKIAGEVMLHSLYQRYKEEKDFNFVGLRYMNVYGPRQDTQGAYIAVIMKILDLLDQGKNPIVYGDGSQAYDFIYVKDCALANICSMTSEATDNFYNVGTGIKTSIKELTEKLIELHGSHKEIDYHPAGQTFVTNRIGCPEKAKKDLGFQYTVDLEEGLKKLIAWRKEFLGLN